MLCEARDRNEIGPWESIGGVGLFGRTTWVRSLLSQPDEIVVLARDQNGRGTWTVFAPSPEDETVLAEGSVDYDPKLPQEERVARAQAAADEGLRNLGK